MELSINPDSLRYASALRIFENDLDEMVNDLKGGRAFVKAAFLRYTSALRIFENDLEEMVNDRGFKSQGW